MTNTNIYTRLNNLVCVLRADEDNCDLVEDVKDTVNLCRNYVGMVDRMEANIRTARETMDAEDFRRRVQTLDMNRRTAHEGLMIDVNMLNKICANIGIPPVADVDEDNRESYYSFAKKVAEAAELGEFQEW